MNALDKQAGQNLEHNHGMQHYHSMAHYHSAGTLKITGSTGGNVLTESNGELRGTGAMRIQCPSSKNTIGSSGSHYWGYGTVSIDTSRASSWSGLTSNVLNSSGSAITNSLTGGSVNSSTSARTTTDNSGGNENRPDNYTIQIWKRTA